MALLLLGAGATRADDKLVFVAQNSQPKYFIGNPAQKGLCGDIYARLKERLAARGVGVVLPDTYLPIKRVLKRVETGEADAFCGAGRNADREKRFHYSTDPVYGVSNILVTWADNQHAPGSYGEIVDKGIRIGALFGTSGARHLRENIGHLIDDRYYTVDEALKKVADRKLDFFYYHNLGLHYQVRTSKLPIKALPTKFRTVPQWMIFSHKTSKNLQKMLDNELSAMARDGVLREIWSNYKVN